ncbi:MAG: phosphate/phosphite/phosphonate ABC transporter substrate-binding protein [Microcoleaceae cyanobacterium]
MFRNFLGNVFILSVAAVVMGCSPQGETTNSTNSTPSESTNITTSTNTEKIIIADISNNPAKKIKRYQPFADYLAANLSEFDIGVGEVQVASDMPTMVQWLKNGDVDLYFDSPYPAMYVTDESGAEVILRRWKGGQADYYTVLFTMKDRDINSVEDLQGKIIAFDELSSTSGYMLPMAYLKQANLKTAQKSSVNETVIADEIGYIFSGDDENTIQWVISGKVDAGAVDIGTFLEIPEANREAMKVLAETDKVARHVVMIKPGMDREKVEAIKTLLLEMNQTEAGKIVLEEFEETAKFDNFPPESDIAKMRELYQQVQNQ